MSNNKTKFSLIDCNNFYVSCERVFDPRMCKMEAIVLSGNDGCVIARSEGAKRMGIEMGAPYFKIKPLVQMAGIITKSSNLTLYGDMSKRVMNVIGKYSPKQEVYSIDESFLEFGTEEDISKEMKKLKKEVLQSTGIPVCVGTGNTKTLAKLANRIAKKDEKTDGVFEFIDEEQVVSKLGEFDAEDVWGIGNQSAEKLKLIGVVTALDFFNADKSVVKGVVGISGVKTWEELHGKRCFDLETSKADQKQIVSSQTFGKELSDFDELNAGVASLARKAINRLRKQGLYAGKVEIFCNTNPFKDKEQKNNISGSIKLSFSSADYSIIPFISKKLRIIYKENVKFHKGGVVLKELSKSYRQQDLFVSNEEVIEPMESIVKINEKYGDCTRYGSEENGEYMYQTSSKSPSYTTDWENLPSAK